MTRLYPPPEPPKQEAKDKPKEKEKEDSAGSSIASAFGSDAAAKLPKPMSSFGRGKGTIFMVGAKSRDVLWSTFALPKDSRPATLERTAGKNHHRAEKGPRKKVVTFVSPPLAPDSLRPAAR